MPGGKAKYRRFTQLVNAENPVYLYNYAEGSRDLDMLAPAICGEQHGVMLLGLGGHAFSKIGMEELMRGMLGAVTSCLCNLCSTPVSSNRPHDLDTPALVVCQACLVCQAAVAHKLELNCSGGATHAGIKHIRLGTTTKRQPG